MDTVYLNSDDPRSPPALRRHLGDQAPSRLAVWGSLDLLNVKARALFCSIRCPGRLILHTHDLAQALRQAGGAVIGGSIRPWNANA